MRAEINVPETVMVPKGAKTVELDILCSLHNESEDDLVVAADSEGEAHFWHLLNRNQREVQRRPAMRGSMCSQFVAERTTHAETARVVLNASKLEDGETYTLRYRMFGESAEADFVVFHQRVAPPKKKGKKKTKKKPAKRKPAKKKAAKKAKKKPAKKKPARKKKRSGK